MRVGPQPLTVGPVQFDRGSYFISPTALEKAVGLTLSSFYCLKEASGTVNDLKGSAHLAVTGTPLFRTTTGGNVGVRYKGSTDGHSAAVNEPGLASCIIGAVGSFGTAPSAGLPGIIGKSSSTAFPSFLMYRANDIVKYPTLLVRDAVSTLTLIDVSDNCLEPNTEYLFMAQVDRSANQARFLVASAHKLVTFISGSIAGFGTLSGGTTPKFCIGAGSVTIGGNNISMGFYLTGAQCEGATLLTTIANKMGYGL